MYLRAIHHFQFGQPGCSAFHASPSFFSCLVLNLGLSVITFSFCKSTCLLDATPQVPVTNGKRLLTLDCESAALQASTNSPALSAVTAIEPTPCRKTNPPLSSTVNMTPAASVLHPLCCSLRSNAFTFYSGGFR